MTELFTWESAIDSYAISLTTKRLSEKTRYEYITIVKDLKAFVFTKFDIKYPSQITSYHLRCYINEFNNNNFRNANLGRKKRALYLFFDHHIQQGNITENPSIDLMKINRRKKLFNDEFAKKLPAIQNNNFSTVLPDQNVNIQHDVKTITAHDIKTYLDTKVVGQELAKIQISVLLSMHMNWFTHEARMHRSPNAILIGPTGVGKTHTIRVASEYLKIPFITVDTTTLVPSGIAGLQVEDILGDLVREANEIIKQEGRRRYINDDIDLARRGIIFFDEFDKINAGGNSRTYDQSNNLSVQRSLLKLTDGSKKGVGVRGHISTEEPRSIDTSGILILAGGAFVGIDQNEIRTLRPAELQRELAKSNNVNTLVSADIVNFGFMPELVARLPVIVEYKQLDENDLLNILNNSDVSPIQTWVEHFKQLGKTLTISEDAKYYTIKKATILKMGARGLQQVLFQTLARLAYSIESSPESVFTIGVEQLDPKTSPSKNGEL